MLHCAEEARRREEAWIRDANGLCRFTSRTVNHIAQSLVPPHVIQQELGEEIG
jgi:hypothetical protein